MSGLITDLLEPSVSEDGTVSFLLPPENPSSTWSFEGTVNADGTGIMGSHLLFGESGGSAGGSWEAVRR